MKHFTLILIAAVMILSCNNNSKNSETQIAGKSTKNCLTDLDLDYDQLLSIEEVAQALSLSVEDLRKKSIDRKDQYGEAYYFWKSDRPDIPSLLSIHVQMPDENFIGISGLNPFDDDYSIQEIKNIFEFRYKKLNEEEVIQLQENTAKHLEDKSEDEKKSIEGIVEQRKKSSYEKVENFGESAFWRFSTERGGELVILYGNEQFTIYIKTNYKNQRNLEVAKKLAEFVMNKCN